MTEELAGLLPARRAAIARAWDLGRGAVLVASGVEVPIVGTDQVHEFHAHNEHQYLAGLATPGQVLAFDPSEGWTLFGRVAGREERVWSGDAPSLELLGQQAGIERVKPVSALSAWLEPRRAEPIALIGNDDLRRKPDAYGLDGWGRLELVVDDELSVRLSEQVSEARRRKDPAELARMREAAAASVRGHLAGMRAAHTGMDERRLRTEVEVEFFRAGAERTAYATIAGSGPNGAILHFMPTRRELQHGDLVLVDAGAEIEGYASDVTRTYPVGPRFTSEQRDLYELVLSVQDRAINGFRPGVEYRDLHMAAALDIAEGLVSMGILRGNPADLVERDAHALFFPHGLGHMLGLATHDAGGCLAGRQPSDRFGLRYLRADLPVEAGFVMTIEPGVYFIDAILMDPDVRRSYRDAVDWERVDRMRGFGGIRIEDDVLATETGAEVLTAALPKSVAEIEGIRAEALNR